MDETQEYIKKCGEYAKENGFNLNPNPEAITKGLFENEKKYGAKYCPCRRITGDKQKDANIICPCVFHKGEIEKDGHCLCRLYCK